MVAARRSFRAFRRTRPFWGGLWLLIGGLLLTRTVRNLYAVDLESGGATLLATSEGYLTAGIAPNGAIVVAGFTDVDVEPGAPVTVLAAPDDGTFYDLDW